MRIVNKSCQKGLRLHSYQQIYTIKDNHQYIKDDGRIKTFSDSLRYSSTLSQKVEDMLQKNQRANQAGNRRYKPEFYDGIFVCQAQKARNLYYGKRRKIPKDRPLEGKERKNKIKNKK